MACCWQDFIEAWNLAPALADDVRKFFIYQISKDGLGALEEATIFAEMPRLLQARRPQAPAAVLPRVHSVARVVSRVPNHRPWLVCDSL
jgi:hypothetical protein